MDECLSDDDSAAVGLAREGYQQPILDEVARCHITREKIPKLLIKLRARVRSNKEFENTSQWQRDPKNTIPQWSRTPKCDPKKFRFWCFLAQWETFLDRVLAFDPTEESCYLGRIATAKGSQIPYWSAPSLAISLTVFPTTTAVAARSARHCGLSKSFWLQAD